MKKDIEQLKEEAIKELRSRFPEHDLGIAGRMVNLESFVLSKLSELEQAVREEDKELNRNVGGKHFMFLDEAGELSDEVWELLEKRLKESQLRIKN